MHEFHLKFTNILSVRQVKILQAKTATDQRTIGLECLQSQRESNVLLLVGRSFEVCDSH